MRGYIFESFLLLSVVWGWQLAAYDPGRYPVLLSNMKSNCWFSQVLNPLAACNPLYMLFSDLAGNPHVLVDEFAIELQGFLALYRTASINTELHLNSLDIKNVYEKFLVQNKNFRSGGQDDPAAAVPIILKLFGDTSQNPFYFNIKEDNSKKLRYSLEFVLEGNSTFAEWIVQGMSNNKIIVLQFPSVLVLIVVYLGYSIYINTILSDFRMLIEKNTMQVSAPHKDEESHYSLFAMVMRSTNPKEPQEGHYYSWVRYRDSWYLCDESHAYALRLNAVDKVLDDGTISVPVASSKDSKGAVPHILKNGFEELYKGTAHECRAFPTIFFYERKSVGGASKAVSELQEQLQLFQALSKT